MDPSGRAAASIDALVESLYVRTDEALEGAKRAGVEAGMPAIEVSTAQRAFLSILARSIGEASSDDDRVRAMRGFHEHLAHVRGIRASTLQTVGPKGWDGFTVVLVEGRS